MPVAMDEGWGAVIVTVAILLLYDLLLVWARRRLPARVQRARHVRLRTDWFEALSAQRGSEILAVQTLRNAVMAASMTASTAALGLMGTVTLAVSSFDSVGALRMVTPRLALELLLMLQLFAALVCSALSVRYFNHAGFIAGMPVDSPQRRDWSATGIEYLRLGGLFYGRGLRYLVLVAPPVAAIAHPLAGPVAGVVAVGFLVVFDRTRM